jgi:methylenetetrahydrofolate reductase (NADPH)
MLPAMRIDRLYAERRPVYSFEFFPPKSEAAAAKLERTIAELRHSHDPDFVSVTYGAAGSTRRRTVELVTRIQEELGLTTMAHLTCVGHNANEIREVVGRLAAGGIENILALRGDPPKGAAHFRVAEGGLAHASELVQLLRENFDLSVGGACYPEDHIESENSERDLAHTAHKVTCGAQFLITQLFFDNRDYFRFVERARALGIQVPIVPGIMPITNLAQIERFTKMCGARIPSEFHAGLRGEAENPEAVMALGVEHAATQCRELLAAGAPGIHFYTLNQSYATRAILAAIQGA